MVDRPKGSSELFLLGGTFENEGIELSGEALDLLSLSQTNGNFVLCAISWSTNFLFAWRMTRFRNSMCWLWRATLFLLMPLPHTISPRVCWLSPRNKLLSINLCVIFSDLECIQSQGMLSASVGENVVFEDLRNEFVDLVVGLEN